MPPSEISMSQHHTWIYCKFSQFSHLCKCLKIENVCLFVGKSSHCHCTKTSRAPNCRMLKYASSLARLLVFFSKVLKQHLFQNEGNLQSGLNRTNEQLGKRLLRFPKFITSSEPDSQFGQKSQRISDQQNAALTYQQESLLVASNYEIYKTWWRGGFAGGGCFFSRVDHPKWEILLSNVVLADVRSTWNTTNEWNLQGKLTVYRIFHTHVGLSLSIDILSCTSKESLVILLWLWKLSPSAPWLNIQNNWTALRDVLWGHPAILPLSPSWCVLSYEGYEETRPIWEIWD